MQELIFIVYLIGFIALTIWIIKGLINSSANTPTWNGIIISAIMGVLPLYLFLCFFGFIGEKKDNDEKQSNIGNYADNMRRRYAYDDSSRKKWHLLKFVAVLFVAIFIFHILRNDESNESAITERVDTLDTDTIVIQNDEIIVEPVIKHTTNRSEANKQGKEKNIPSVNSNIILSTIENNNKITDENLKSTIELLEGRNHDSVVEQAKGEGVSTEGSAMEILERINHANVVKQAKREGVSAEGSTIEILERINHANVVKQAKREGVSTEGSTIEILERINRKYLEKYIK